MSDYYYLALEAGYSGREARHYAEYLEQQDYEYYQRSDQVQQQRLADQCDYYGHQPEVIGDSGAFYIACLCGATTPQPWVVIIKE